MIKVSVTANSEIEPTSRSDAIFIFTLAITCIIFGYMQGNFIETVYFSSLICYLCYIIDTLAEHFGTSV